MVGGVRAATDQWIRAGMARPAEDVANDLADLLGSAHRSDHLITTSEEHR